MTLARELRVRSDRFSRLAAFVVTGVLLVSVTMPSAQESSEPAVDPRAAGKSFGALVRDLDSKNWVPPYFPGRVTVFDPVEEDRRLRAMAAEPATTLEVGMYSYKVSPKRAEEGRRLFYLYDFGTADNWRASERYMFYAAGATTAEDLRSKFGVLIEPQGHLIGLVGMPSPDGRVDYGWSCALCHAAIGPDGAVVAGAPNHAYDNGRFRHRGLVEHIPHPAFVTAGYVDRDVPVEHLMTQGPGRMDRNADRVENPVKIPPLWGLKAIRSGLYANGTGANFWFALARHNGGVHPASEYMEALIAYLLTLEPPPNPRPKGAAETRGEEAFRKAECASCHSGPYYTNGEIVAIDVIGTDPARVKQEFPKAYRVPTLRRLDLQRLYLHDGTVASLGDLFARSRLSKAKGHAYGIDLTEEEKKDLVAFLLSI
ncbi:MAG: c-type cytochrome [Acidobacteria bacterium]|nr:c-type cytochrome [Acidobacteriota bacterium]